MKNKPHIVIKIFLTISSILISLMLIYYAIRYFEKFIPIENTISEGIVVNKDKIPLQSKYGVSYLYYIDILNNNKTLSYKTEHHIYNQINTKDKITFKYEKYLITQSYFIYKIISIE